MEKRRVLEFLAFMILIFVGIFLFTDFRTGLVIGEETGVFLKEYGVFIALAILLLIGIVLFFIVRAIKKSKKPKENKEIDKYEEEPEEQKEDKLKEIASLVDEGHSSLDIGDMEKAKRKYNEVYDLYSSLKYKNRQFYEKVRALHTRILNKEKNSK